MVNLFVYLALLDDPQERCIFEQLYHAHRRTMLHVAWRVLRDEKLAEDAVHEAFLRVIKNISKFERQDCRKTRSLVVIIVQNTAIDIYRKRKRGAALNETLLTGELFTCDAPPEDGNRVQQAIDGLPVQYAAVLTLRYLHGYGDDEIAAMLGITTQNVRQRALRGKKLLAACLQEEGIEV